jgi:uncharacterized protein YukE
MSNDYHRAHLTAQAGALRDVAKRLATHGVGDRWEGPSRDQCELALDGLHHNLLELSRKLDHLAHYVGSSSVMARLG